MSFNHTISVIIPVYNVEPYLEQSLQSVSDQTFSDFEALLILGKSSDRSGEICEEWVRKDKRFRIIEQPGRGLGSARNLGIEVAAGDYIAFLDSDDWWDPAMLSKLYASIVSEDADMSMCDRFNVYYDENGGMNSLQRLTELSMYDKACSAEENKDIIRTIEVSVNGKLYRKTLFTENSIIQPDCFGEDRAIMHFLIAKCRRISKVKEPLYYYRCDRKNNSVGSARTYLTASDCMQYIYDLFDREVLVEKFRTQLDFIFWNTARIARDGLLGNNPDKIDIGDAMESIDSFIKSHCSNRFDRLFILGSYSLRHSIWMRLPFGNERIHFCFSSLISMFSNSIPDSLNLDFSGQNEARRNWINYDLKKEFRKRFNPKENDIFFIDFLEERHDLLQIGKSYITKSEILMDAIDDKNKYQVLSRLSPESEVLWKEKCIDFIRFLKGCIPADRVVLVRMKLTDRYRVEDTDFLYDNADEIHEINRMLDRYYDFFIDNYEGINVINASTDYMYTAHDFHFGRYPWHMNDLYYMRMGELLETGVGL